MASSATSNNPISILCNQRLFDVALGEAENATHEKNRIVLDDGCLTLALMHACTHMHADANVQKGGEGVPKLRYSRCRVVFFTSSFRLPFANSRFSGSLSASGNFTPPNPAVIACSGRCIPGVARPVCPKTIPRALVTRSNAKEKRRMRGDGHKSLLIRPERGGPSPKCDRSTERTEGLDSGCTATGPLT